MPLAMSQSPPKTVAVVGAGFSGLSAAYELAQRGHRPILFEAEGEIGGLAATCRLGDLQVERFYHHWFTHDRDILDLVGELGLADRVLFMSTRTGMYFANRLYRLSTPVDVLRFSPLPFFDRLRLGRLVLAARRVRTWREIDHLSAAEWLRALGGERVYRVVWEPLLKGKFGPHAEEVSAAWFWAKLRLRGGSRGARGQERLAYFRGGFAVLAEEIVRRIVAAGGEVRLNAPVTGLAVEDGEVRGVATPSGMAAADAVVLTPATPIIAPMIEPHISEYAKRLAAIDYLANICVVLDLRRSLSELYWMNVNDPSFPFVGVIEHTNLDQASAAGDRHVVYLSRYLPASDPAFGWSDEETIAFTLPHLRRMFPQFQPDWIRGVHVWKARYAQPIVTRGFGDLVPEHETPIAGAFIASMAQIYPEDRGTNYAVRDGRKVGALVDAWLQRRG